MITYDYHCDANETTLTVRHSIKETLSTWGELCARANQHPGDTPPETPVRRLFGGGNVMFKGTKCATSQGSSCSCC
ncbi:MAG: zinc ribbon domain-containing protein [Nitrospira sp. SB0677_bin_15]|nr:zinc ribbon domain-containing protein [Nitrospira sp. SB0677_bin_15]